MIAIRYLNELKLGNISDEDFPTFCYEDDFCDPLDIEAGLFRGTFLLRVCNKSYPSTKTESVLSQTFCRIFTGPSSVLLQKPGLTSKRKCNADIIGLVKVTPQSIAYAVVQVSSGFVLYAPHSDRILHSGASCAQ
jgi:hypothetical protein